MDVHHFYIGIIERIKRSFDENQKTLDVKAESLKALIMFLMLGVIATTLAIAILPAF